MAKYVVPPELDALLRKMQLDIKSLQQKVANLGPVPVGSGGSVFDANVIWNGSMESGVFTYARVYAAVGSIGTTHAETADPLAGIISLREDESAGSATRLFWLPGGSSGAPVVGNDVFATAPSDVWKVSCKIRSNTNVADAKLYATVGDTAPNVYGLPGFTNTTWLLAASSALTAGSVATLSGQVTVPASRSFIGLHVAGAETPPGAAWSWTLDEVTLQRKLT